MDCFAIHIIANTNGKYKYSQTQENHIQTEHCQNTEYMVAWYYLRKSNTLLKLETCLVQCSW